MDEKQLKKKKISLQDAIKQQLERKKQQTSSTHSSSTKDIKTKRMSSQLTKKPNNQRKRMGI
ncbi:hypothetical protein RYX56_04155 [Alkalihalophilus lindianensis]|uniref:Uncharacterized protein n=1 Tax=Alkalihalophilus lindianensis TaxID=1630542 RepID=A0ABU3X6P5_9BACI|nr:hypothetical protein [Alkalihalophilus lindianensis]MDV2683566.1 hypothetical protein [Alkalihalophilus lindianensis]